MYIFESRNDSQNGGAFTEQYAGKYKMNISWLVFLEFINSISLSPFTVNLAEAVGFHLNLFQSSLTCLLY